MEDDNKHVKVLFRYYSDVLEEETVETLWAIIVDEKRGLYKIDNIPFYGPLVASDDIVFAEYDDLEQMLVYRSTVEHSGNSIIQVVLMTDDAEISKIREVFASMGCLSEGVNKQYFVLEVPAKKDYKPIRDELEKLVAGGLIDYAEPCLSTAHSLLT
ncbi:MAG: DUF4265 domain-containing protein [Mucilaginibacter sp.]